MAKDMYQHPEFAERYDWVWADYTDDVALYSRLAEEHGDPILDVACGTGRTAVPLARAGFQVVGVDRSPAMLDVARRKLATEDRYVRERVELVEADMTEFDLGRTFPLIIMPFDSAFHVGGRYTMGRCFKCLFNHARPDSLCVIDCTAPEAVMDQPMGREVTLKQGRNPNTNIETRAVRMAKGLSWDTQAAQAEYQFIEGDGKEKRKLVFQEDYRWLTRDEAVEALLRAGFHEVDALGDFDGSPFTRKSPRLILIAQRLDRDMR